MSARVLIVDDDLDAAEALCEVLSRDRCVFVACTSAEDAVVRIEGGGYDAVITDVQMDGMNGIELCERVRHIDSDVMTIVITGHASVNVAVEAIRAGAFDFVLKPISVAVLEVALDRALQYRALRTELRQLRAREPITAPGLVGDSRAIRDLVALIHQIADNDATVLVTGESGTGKELVAREIHNQSPRRDHPFVAINCAAMPASLLESELFGHVRGAFTDAKQARPGLIVQAGRGTLFLDEIGEMPGEMQAKLLRVLQQRTVRPVGGDLEVAFAARFIAATNRDLEAEVAEKRFREDLFYRINVVHLAVPPLRSRKSDILPLAQHFVQKIARRTGKGVEGLTLAVAERLLDYDWPGNVRELENCIERAIALARSSEMTIDGLPDKIRDHRSSPLVVDIADLSELITLAEMERRYVERVLASLGGNKTQAARALGIDRRSLMRRLSPSPDAPPPPPPPTPPS